MLENLVLRKLEVRYPTTYLNVNKIKSGVFKLIISETLFLMELYISVLRCYITRTNENELIPRGT